jgi:molecular chaperone HtpG
VIGVKKRTEKEAYFKAGMYLLETLTAGMYNEPLSIYREYIQNAVDSIDLSNRNTKRRQMKVNIHLIPIERSIIISDNGQGIPVQNAEQTLSSIGISDKTNNGLRGFRGIGRLGGIAFSEKATYRTKAEGEKTESIQEWDCKQLRKILSDSKDSSMTLEGVFKQTTTFNHRNSRRFKGSYFEVVLEGVSSFRNYILDIERVRNYLSQITPVPFNHDEFSYAEKIDKYLASNLSHYGKYEITVNGDPVYKPYRDNVRITKKGFDYIEDINLFEIKIRNIAVAFGWYGKRRDLLGAIAKGEKGSGISVRAGNILIGDSHLLDGCFREPRFHSYVIGEIHVDCSDLVPNSRRDDFIDNEMKTLFYDAIEREVGLPISKEIRLRSRISSQSIDNPSKKRNQDISEDTQDREVLNEILKSCEGCPKLSNLLSKINKEKGVGNGC